MFSRMPTEGAAQFWDTRQMDKIVTQLLWFDRLCVTTANSSALTRMAQLIERGNYAGFRTLFGELGDRLSIKRGTHASVWDDLTIVLPEALYPALAARLRELVLAEEHSSVFLSELERSLPNHSRNNWEIRRVEHHSQPERDYSPEPDGTVWEAILWHDVSNSKILKAAWEEIVQWSLPSDQSDPQTLSVNFNGSEPSSESHDPKSAFEVYLSGRSPIKGSGYPQSPIQVVGFQHLPFRIWYGEALDRMQVWFQPNQVVLIVPDRHAETGCLGWDLENFFSYYSLVRTVSRTVSAKRFAWWISPDSTDDSAALAIGELDNPETLWGLFSRLTVADRALNRTRFDQQFSLLVKNE